MNTPTPMRGLQEVLPNTPRRATPVDGSAFKFKHVSEQSQHGSKRGVSWAVSNSLVAFIKKVLMPATFIGGLTVSAPNLYQRVIAPAMERNHRYNMDSRAQGARIALVTGCQKFQERAMERCLSRVGKVVGFIS